MPSQTLLDGPRRAVIKITNAGTVETTGKVVVDVSALDPPADEVKIEKIHYQIANLNVAFSWADTTAPVIAQTLFAGNGVAEGCFDYSEFGGLINNAPGGELVGDLTIDTQISDTSASLNGGYTIILELVKKYES